jgi:hypothetical protein
MVKDYAIEKVILRHSARGMDILEQFLPEDFCRRAAEAILAQPHGTVLLTTGFYVAGFAETDGPMGTFFLAQALNELGYHAVIVTDEICRGYFSGIDTKYVSYDSSDDDYEQILQEYAPVCCISVERCGANRHQDYANMRGISIKEHTAPIDRMFELAMEQDIMTIGVGDGGNEIGMGNLRKEIRSHLSLEPCTVEVTYPVIATVSNWGAYGLIAYLAILSGKKEFPPFDAFWSYLQKTVDMGSVDGILKEAVCKVDGFDRDVEQEIIESLSGIVKESDLKEACA